ncbi:hypothetical protein SARC_05239 [Sphaeroforma arctica JP610]|uniref:Uncharacterized protein n=1 Tax=Sphaeroforma arctica JP610 TaxID=667725 RepID=A0A0L0G0U6_9EUKA|nr:hypothetical protein SARC_05239 [Sphaeroforma arctica JP610]KNC82469.1 hypothetical protein SARC_05239 [Sphaeroforma arctica JP610]|eukprot:XP_014156371.1 hypothetical protein SARC_05239 [Sphaeroforma arctica JP610]
MQMIDRPTKELTISYLTSRQYLGLCQDVTWNEIQSTRKGILQGSLNLTSSSKLSHDLNYVGRVKRVLRNDLLSTANISIYCVNINLNNERIQNACLHGLWTWTFQLVHRVGDACNFKYNDSKCDTGFSDAIFIEVVRSKNIRNRSQVSRQIFLGSMNSVMCSLAGLTASSYRETRR